MTRFEPVLNTFRRFLDDENGATAIEYGLIIGLVFLAIVGAIRSYASETGSMYSEIISAMDSVGK